MTFSLFWKECRQNIKSLTYFIYVCCLVLFFVTQLGDMEMISKPEPGQRRYGTILSDDPKVQMRCALKELFYSYTNNYYVTYPLGFYKRVTLSGEEQERVKEVLELMTGEPIEKLEAELEAYEQETLERLKTPGMEDTIADMEPFVVEPDEDITYETFLEKMKTIDAMLGGGSSFSEKAIKNNAQEDMTYEQAEEEYEKIIKKDKVSGAYAREFCDYFGILLGILPVFLAVTRAVRDQRSKVFEVVASKQISSVKLMMIRYLAVVTAAIIPVIVLAVSPAMQTLYLAESLGASLDLLIYPKYLVGWLLPSVLFSVSAGFFLSELAGGAAGILVMGLFWIINLFQNTQLVGSVGWSLIPRFNCVGQRSLFESIFGELAKNRIGYTIAACLLLIAAIWIYDRKRKGRWMKNGRSH